MAKKAPKSAPVVVTSYPQYSDSLQKLVGTYVQLQSHPVEAFQTLIALLTQKGLHIDATYTDSVVFVHNGATGQHFSASPSRLSDSDFDTIAHQCRLDVKRRLPSGSKPIPVPKVRVAFSSVLEARSAAALSALVRGFTAAAVKLAGAKASSLLAPTCAYVDAYIAVHRAYQLHGIGDPTFSFEEPEPSESYPVRSFSHS